MYANVSMLDEVSIRNARKQKKNARLVRPSWLSLLTHPESIFVGVNKMRGALNGDRVKVGVYHRTRNGRLEGEIPGCSKDHKTSKYCERSQTDLECIRGCCKIPRTDQKRIQVEQAYRYN